MCRLLDKVVTIFLVHSKLEKEFFSRKFDRLAVVRHVPFMARITHVITACRQTAVSVLLFFIADIFIEPG
jgi:hypothetical protein